jgi:xanthine/CO dehydrogenase XdhC/CoxF family maturation factor
MSELDRILGLWQSDSGATREAVLTTVVHVKGSAYRRPGARMLILADGRRIGSISGGCLEGDVCRKAWWFTENGQPSVRVYDTSSEDDAVWEFGLGCNGIVHVLFERVGDAGTAEMLRFLGEARAARRPVTVATVIAAAERGPCRVGERLLFDGRGVQGGRLAGSPVAAEVVAQVRESFARQKNHLAHLEGCDVFVETVLPPQALVVFGAGHDAQPLVRMAAELGWQVTVADGRRSYATAERFPEAARVAVIDPREPLRGIEIDRDTAVVMMTHNFPQDAKLLPHILPRKPRYLGMLGPKSRTEDLFAEVGLPVTGIDVHAPVGLDIGSDLPEAIALSIVAEIQAFLENRSGRMLKHREGPIHDSVYESGQRSGRLVENTEIAICDLS